MLKTVISPLRHLFSQLWKICTLGNSLFSRNCSYGKVLLRVPGVSYNGGLSPVPPKEHDQAIQLNRHVTALAETIGERNIAHYAELQKSSAYMIHEFRQIGYDPREEEYVADGRLVKNIEVQLTGAAQPEENPLKSLRLKYCHLPLCLT